MTSGAQIVAAVRGDDRSTAPLMRWWWFSSHVTAEAIDADLDAMRNAGIGGVELAFIYPVAEGGPAFGTPEFLALVAYAARGAESRGMRFDLTLGAGWPFGGPHIDASTAARRIHWETVEIAPGSPSLQYRPSFVEDTVVGAYIGAGSLQEMPTEWATACVDDERIHLPRLGDGPRVLLIATSRLTGQNVKRAPHGAEGLVLDHYSEVAARTHLREVAKPLLDAAGAERVFAGFCDSFEVYGADWTPDLPDQFRARRGYDLIPVLWKTHMNSPDTEGVRADLLRTLSELFEERFLAVFRNWTAQHGILFRAQCYGEPPMLMSSFRHVDLIEGEGWGWRRWTKNTWAVSAASAYDVAIVSSETWTWVRSPSFRAGPLDLLGEAYEHFLGGVNLLFGHGWPVGAALGSDQPVFYASGALDARNPWWDVAPDLFAALTRVSAALQLGRRASSVAIYHPVAELRARSEGERPFDLWRQTRRFVDDDFVAAVRTEGLDFDLVDDAALAASGCDRYDVVFVPSGCTPTDAAETILAASSARVIRLSAGFGLGREQEIRGALADIAPLLHTSSPSTVGVVTRELGDARVSLVVNTSSRASDVVLSAPGRALTIWDAVSGEVRASSPDGTATVRLDSYEGVIVAQAGEILAPARDATPLPRRCETLEWSVASAGTRRPVIMPHVWEDDPLVDRDAEHLTYESAFTVANASMGEIDFGDALPGPATPALRKGSFALSVDPPVGVAARVFLDGASVGSIWRPPYALPLGVLEPGDHVVRIEVSGLGVRATANRTVDGTDRSNRVATGSRYRVQDSERRKDALRTGILGVPEIRFSIRDQ